MMDVQTLVTVIIGVIAIVGVAASVWRRERYASNLAAATTALSAATATGQAWREERDAEVARSSRIEAELIKAQDEIRILKDRVAELEQRPDLRALEHLIEMNEERAAARTDKVLASLEHIAAVLAVEAPTTAHDTTKE